MTNLQDLLERVTAATGPDRELDAAIALTQGWPVYRGDNWIGPHAEISVPAYTASLDNAVALIESRLPGWWWAVGHYGPHGKCTANVSRDGKKHGNDVVGATPALALLAALLRTLVAQQSDAAPHPQEESAQSQPGDLT